MIYEIYENGKKIHEELSECWFTSYALTLLEQNQLWIEESDEEYSLQSLIEDLYMYENLNVQTNSN